MPGRQAHGRSLTAGQPKAKKAPAAKKGSKARSQKNALNAFGIAQEMYPTRDRKTPRFRELDADVDDRKHGRDEGDDDDDEDEDDYDQPPQKKRAKVPSRNNDDADYGSDSEGNEWRMGGMADDDEDSEIESDDAFGDSDDGKFDEYAFGGSKSKGKRRDEDSDSDDSEDDQGETLGEEAIDLATALDQWEESEEEQPKKKGDDASSSEEEDDDDSGSEGSDESEDSDEDSDDSDEADPEKLEALRGAVSRFGGEEDDAEANKKSSAKAAIDMSELGLTGIDPTMKKSTKQMKKDESGRDSKRSRKIDVPLTRREQGRVDRAAAYDKTTETLNRWTDTVKQNRRAEHLVFPLPDPTGKAGLDMTEMQPLMAASAPQEGEGAVQRNELESAIFSIMDQSGLSMERPKKEKAKVYDEDGNELSRREAVNLRRRERELAAREAKRAARVKKIKSKAYHRVHRRQEERDAMRADDGAEVDSEEEREAQDRRRALERVGQRHRESKWAKMGGKAKRAVWDDDFRSGINDMARRDEELRRRKEGKRSTEDGELDSDDDTSSSGSDSEDDGQDRGGAKLRRQIDEELQRDLDEAPKKGLMSMAFMQKAENAKRKELEELRDSIAAADGDNLNDDSDEGPGEIGRRQYGAGAPGVTIAGAPKVKADKPAKQAPAETAASSTTTVPVKAKGGLSTPAAAANTPDENPWAAAAPPAAAPVKDTDNPWATDVPARRRKRDAALSSSKATLDLSTEKGLQTLPKPRRRGRTGAEGEDEDADEDDEESHLPLAIRDQKLLERAFAHDDTELEFAQEKAQAVEDDGDQVVDKTMPGWGSWVGEGVSAREKRRHQGRFLEKTKGIKAKDRKDAKLDKVIVNEKRQKKNARYLATQLPHPFESREQYERSLRLPMGPEWQTKETFQDSTKPRVLMKQGVIKPMSRPTAQG